VEHGAFCTGCCRALMALLFVPRRDARPLDRRAHCRGAGKNAPRAKWLSTATGVLLACWGDWVLLRGWS
jgi:predicted metal-binding membrane protein